MTIKNICVFCSSSDRLGEHFFYDAESLGNTMVKNGWQLVYGGTNIGLMGRLARTVKNKGGVVTGVIPEHIKAKGIAYNDCSQLIVTPDMSSRKQEMIRMSDAFIALPGGFGTLEEITEVITLKQLQQHASPVIFFNKHDFYTPLATFFERLFDQEFTARKFQQLYAMVNDVKQLEEYLINYKAFEFSDKWSV